MGSELGITGHSKPKPVITPVSIWWNVWCCVWTVAVASGIVFLIVRRKSPILRIRGLGLSLSAIVLLHLYWISVQIGMTVGPLAPGDAQFWIMGTYLPCGVALFHASNSRFLHVAKMQKRYLPHGKGVEPESKPKRGLIGRFQRLDYNIKIVSIVSVGMIVQILLTLLMYLISRKYHASWGIPGTGVHGTPMQVKAQMGRGWEW